MGDSMVEGMLPLGEQNFVALLGQLAPAAEHVNAGSSGSATDGQLRLAQQILAEGNPSHIVLFVYTNDLHEIDDPHVCCNDQPLYALEAGNLVSNCPELEWSPSITSRMRRSQLPPLALVSLPYSKLVRQLSWAAGLLLAATLPSTGDPEYAARVIEAAVRDLAARCAANGVGFNVVLMPDREAVEDRLPNAAGQSALQFDAVTRAWPGALDARPAAEGWVADGLDGLWATHMVPNDGHLGVGGHAAFARWLVAELRGVWPEVYGAH